MKLVIVSGLSGAGKTVALKQYEDLGYYCIDNMPLALVGPLALRALRQTDKRYEHLALGVDARENPRELARFTRHLERLRARGIDTHVLFLYASDASLLHRYSETRRKHPLSDPQTSLVEAIARERKLLGPIANAADLTLDTSALNLHELREKILAAVPGAAGKLAVTLMSFGYKNGTPANADYVFDIRCLPNPHWDASLREKNGLSPEIGTWLESHAEVPAMRADLLHFLERWLPSYTRQDRAYLTIAIGCTGGKHRSVYMVEKLAQALRSKVENLNVQHRELWAGVDRRHAKAAP